MNTEPIKFKYMHKSYVCYLSDEPTIFLDNKQCDFKGILFILLSLGATCL